MKTIFKYILRIYLKYITKLVLLIHQPTIIAIAGSINKPFAKEAIKKTLENLGLNARANPKNFNTEIGLPLAILAQTSGYNSFTDWLPIIIAAPKRIFTRKFPDYLVLGLGTSNPGDMKYLLSIVKPKITIITDITQRYLESFSDMNELVGEYEYLISRMPASGLLITNNDNARLVALSERAKCRVITFAIKNPADYQARDIKPINTGQKFSFHFKNKIESARINRFGKHHIMAFLVGRIIKNYVVK
ncbi:hypothetical protein KAR28_01285 [Candidatus Parcubacteria bacterium]|nr:hypothetical protein [Candidatus Parcubacteria bacterium]